MDALILEGELALVKHCRRLLTCFLACDNSHEQCAVCSVQCVAVVVGETRVPTRKTQNASFPMASFSSSHGSRDFARETTRSDGNSQPTYINTTTGTSTTTGTTTGTSTTSTSTGRATPNLSMGDRSVSSPLNFDLDDLFGEEEMAAFHTDTVETTLSKKRSHSAASSSLSSSAAAAQVQGTAATSATTALTVSRRKKKPKGFPKRPLSGYNIFFKQERIAVLEEHNAKLPHASAMQRNGATMGASSPSATAATDDYDGGIYTSQDQVHNSFKEDVINVSFQDLGKIIGKRWKSLTEDERKKFEYLAHYDSIRYRSEMEAFNESKRKKNEVRIQEASSRIHLLPEDNGSGPSLSTSRWNSLVPVSSGPPPEIKSFFSSQSSAAASATSVSASLPRGEARLPPPLTYSGNASAYTPYEWYNHPHGNSNPSQSPPIGRSGSTTVSSPPTAAADPNDVGNYSMPPGTEIYLCDPQGREHKFKVQYKFYTMSRREAENYMEQMSTATSAPYRFTAQNPLSGSQYDR